MSRETTIRFDKPMDLVPMDLYLSLPLVIST
jgi:hypothetical protein